MQPGMRPAVPVWDDSNNSPATRVLSELKTRLGDRRFALWCEDKVRPVCDGDVLTLAVGSPFLLNCMQKQFQPLLNEVARVVLGPLARAELTVDATLSATAARPTVKTPAAKSEPAPVPIRREAAPTGRQRKLADLSDFVPHTANELAWTACRQVAATPGVLYGTLFLHGVVGTGKTHLLEGICKQLRQTHPQQQVMLLTAEGFANYFTQALEARTLPSFRQRFRGVDVLLVDDVDFFESKRVFQEEFLHTVGELVDHGRQVVVSADRHPKLLTKLSDELVSRFHSGLVCRLESPDLDTRRKIVAAKAAKLDGEFAAEALDYIAERFSGSVRELEGALNCLQTCYAMTRQRVTQSVARQMLTDLEHDCKKIVRIADVERVVCNLFGLKAKDLKSDSRVRTLAQPRMLAMFLARRHTPSAYSEIGQHFGGRNHSTVMSAERKVQQWLTENAPVRIAMQSWTIGEIVSTLEQQLLAG
jgi:chromosomal replication initiator protein